MQNDLTHIPDQKQKESSMRRNPKHRQNSVRLNTTPDRLSDFETSKQHYRNYIERHRQFEKPPDNNEVDDGAF